MVYENEIERAAKDCGAARTASVPPGEIPVDTGFRRSCAMNQCGAFSCRWSCPPALPGIEKMHKELLAYRAAILFQADFSVRDIFDYEAMEEGAQAFYQICRCLERRLGALPGAGRFLVLGAGACRECRECSYPDAPCRRKKGPVMSLEAYGVDVTRLAQAADLPYNAAPELVTYTGLILAD